MSFTSPTNATTPSLPAEIAADLPPADVALDPARDASRVLRSKHRGSSAWRSPKLIVGLTIVGVIVLFGLIGPLVVQDPWAINSMGMRPPSGSHLLGTTQNGQDVFAQLAYATRGSLTIGVIVGVLAVVLSSFFGILGSYMGGIVDELFSLFTNVMLIIPGLPLMIVIGSYATHKGIMMVSLVLAITSWAASARVLRAQTLSIRNRDYVLASRVAGEKVWRVIAIEILPNLLPVLSSQFVFAIIFAILGEAGLSFIGLGASSTLTWGTMLFYAQNGQALLLGGWWWFVPPGLMIAILGAGLSLINFSIDEVINPKLRVARLARDRAQEDAAESAPADSSATAVAMDKSADPGPTTPGRAASAAGGSTASTETIGHGAHTPSSHLKEDPDA